MIANVTFTSLALSSLSRSPFLQISPMYRTPRFNLYKSTVNHFFHSFFSSYSSVSATFSSSTMSNVLNSAIHIEKSTLYRFEIVNTHSNYSPEDYLVVDQMKFLNCHADYDGGAIFIILDTFFICNFTAYSNCTANSKGGAIFSIVPQINFTEGCFSNCRSKLGSAIYCPEASSNFTAEGCFIDYSNTFESVSTDYALYISSHDILVKPANVSNNHISGKSIIFLQKTHLAEVSYLTCFNNTAQDAILELDQMQIVDELNYSHFINSNANAVIKCNSFEVCLSHFYFQSSTVTTYVQFESGVEVSLIDCYFDKGQNLINPNVESTTQCVFNTNYKPGFPAVVTKGCWHHSTYTWSPPRTGLQALVGVIIAVCLIVAFVAVLIHYLYKMKQAKKKRGEMYIPDVEFHDEN